MPSGPTPTQVALQDRVIAFLAERMPPSVIELAPETMIFDTGMLDSLALLDLVTWVEEMIGAPLDPSAVDLTRDWATIADIAAFIDRRWPERGVPAGPPPE